MEPLSQTMKLIKMPTPMHNTRRRGRLPLQMTTDQPFNGEINLKNYTVKADAKKAERYKK
jgi:hypothetical protein